MALIVKIANNIQHKLTYLTPGTTAPEFDVVDRNQQHHTLQDFKGKPVYIHFWSNNSTESIREMVLLDGLHKKYGEKIVFLSIKVDQKQPSMSELAKQKKV